MQPLNRVVRQGIAPMLGVFDRVHLADVRRIRREHLFEQQRSGLDLVGHLVEQRKKLLVSRKKTQSECHAAPRISNLDASGRNHSKQSVTARRQARNPHLTRQSCMGNSCTVASLPGCT